MTLSKVKGLCFAIEAPVKVLVVEFSSEKHEEDEKSEDASAEGRHARRQATVENADLTHLPRVKAAQVRAMVAGFASMWQGQFGEVRITEPRIDLIPGARAVFSQPYRNGPEARKVIRENINDLLEKGCIEPAQPG